METSYLKARFIGCLAVQISVMAVFSWSIAQSSESVSSSNPTGPQVLKHESLAAEMDAILGPQKPNSPPPDQPTAPAPTPSPALNSPDPSDSKDLDPEIVASLDKIKTYFQNYDFTHLPDLMYSPVVSDSGGKQVIIDGMNSSYAKLKGITADVAFTYEPAGKFYCGLTKDYFFVTTHTTVVLNGHHIRTDSFLLFIRPHEDAHWSYIDGAALSSKAPMASEIRDRHLAELPSEVAFPDTEIHNID